MRKFLMPAIVAASVVMSGAAFATTTTVGTIKSLDMAKRSLTLENGISYTLPPNFQDPGLKVGERVSVVWDMNEHAHEATSVKIAN
ncbi:DUF1344 domain-containing protein [Pseudoruegeria sp. HB172150]|uniref:DUF1344 domain-containing protein n=1 Tax=Pseudoruegeria sp. HB172150 TaxID=2721164 RepID=UPI001551C411|nr:DUF1344 domain-containing protein [Pseudoruegeria sp. HB172150]